MFNRDLDFSLEDGNLVLVAGTTAFRVYRGILAKKSTVFANMFDMGSLDPDVTETFDSCPVLRLSDHPEDLRDFLQFLMPCSDVPLLNGAPVPGLLFKQLHAALHLAHKYQCPDVEIRVLFALQKYYTSNFTEYAMYHDDALRPALVRPPSEAAIAAVNIARLTKTHSMLPYALYLAANQEGEMLDGYERRDGSVEHLSAEDLRLCIDARGALAREMASLVKHVFSTTPKAGCRTPNACSARLDAILQSVELSAPGQISVLQPYVDCIEEWTSPDSFCTICKRAMLQREVEARGAVWKLLPEIFGFKPEECGFPSLDDSE